MPQAVLQKLAIFYLFLLLSAVNCIKKNNKFSLHKLKSPFFYCYVDVDEVGGATGAAPGTGAGAPPEETPSRFICSSASF